MGFLSATGAPFTAGTCKRVVPPIVQVPFDEHSVPFGNWSAIRSWDMEAYGLAAVDFQLSQLYYGIQLALALQRTLILPKVCDALATSP